VDDLTWQRRAACRLDPSLMWLEDRVLEAKQLCSVCPVLADCSEWEANLDEFVPGVIAGRDDDERANSRKRCARCRKAIAPTRASSYCRPCKALVASEWRDKQEAGYGRRQCPQCHDWFTVVHGNARFCCEPHRVQFYRLQQNQRRRSHAVTSASVLGSMV
jgi:hypothetical protein